MQCPPEPTGAARFSHVNNIKMQFRKCENGLEGNFKILTFLRAVYQISGAIWMQQKGGFLILIPLESFPQWKGFYALT